jgi:hypothetical protein
MILFNFFSPSNWDYRHVCLTWDVGFPKVWASGSACPWVYWFQSLKLYVLLRKVSCSVTDTGSKMVQQVDARMSILNSPARGNKKEKGKNKKRKKKLNLSN